MNAIITGNDLKDAQGKAIVLGDGNTYHLTFDLGAMCAMEDKYGDFDNAMKVLSSLGEQEKGPDGKPKPKKIMKDIRFMLWQALRHDNDSITERETEKLITLGNINEVMNALGEAMQASAPATEDSGKKEQSPQDA